MQTTQIAACNRLHEVEERLARWILMTQDRIQLDHLPLTQEFLASMLGLRRASVTLSAGILQKAGLISYSRGSVTILDRQKLEAAACDCYAIVQRQLTDWDAETRYTLEGAMRPSGMRRGSHLQASLIRPLGL